MTEKIMILGAGIYQVPLIRKAKEMGLYTIVSSIPGNYPGFAIADQVYYLNTTDKESILEVCEKERVAGICTAGTDIAIATIGYVNHELGLAGITEPAASRAADKTVMQETFHKGGVSAAKFVKADSPEAVRAAADEIGFPVVVKCVDSSGSRGINIVEDPDGLEAAFRAALEVSRKNYVLVEEKLKGTEIGIDGIVQNGEIIFLAPHQKSVWRNGDTVITAGHDFPYQCSDALMEDIWRQTGRAVAALELNDCAINLDAFADGDRLSIIEIGGRSGATCIPELISRCYGFDYYEKILQLALGMKVSCDAAQEPVPCRARLMMCPVDGTITDIDETGLDAIRAEGIDVSLDHGVGDPVEAMHNGTARIGQVIAGADSEEQMRAIMDRVYRCIRINSVSLESLWNE